MMQIEIKEAVHRCLEESGISISPEEKDNVVALITEAVHKLDVEQFETRRIVREVFSNKIEKKRILPHLRGQKLHDFKNEFNTLFQTIHGLRFEDVSSGILEKFALAFATWGAYNLSFLRDQEEIEIKRDIHLESQTQSSLGDIKLTPRKEG